MIFVEHPMWAFEELHPIDLSNGQIRGVSQDIHNQMIPVLSIWTCETSKHSFLNMVTYIYIYIYTCTYIYNYIYIYDYLHVWTTITQTKLHCLTFWGCRVWPNNDMNDGYNLVGHSYVKIILCYFWRRIQCEHMRNKQTTGIHNM